MEKIRIAMNVPGREPFATEVEGEIFGAWAAHLSVSGFGNRVTFLRFGLCVPYDFHSLDGAKRTAQALDAYRDDWDSITAAQIKGIKDGIRAICEREAVFPSYSGKAVGEPAPVSELPMEEA